MKGIGASRRFRTFLLWSARLALLAYIFQITSIDHWHDDLTQIYNHSQFEGMHCHGIASTCAETTGLGGTLVDVPLRMLPPSGVWNPIIVSAPLPVEAFLPVLDKPPRAA